jgi:endonuclease/exonuclease/phosphatase family metal-dependent hydrolase
MSNLRRIGLVVGVIALPWTTDGATAGPLEIQVMTFNIRYGTADDGPDHWEKRRDLLFETIKQSGPDVIGMQEALHFQLDQIEQAVGGYAEIGNGREGGTKGEYSAILYAKDRFRVDASGTFWLSSTPEKVSNDWGNANIHFPVTARLRFEEGPK